MKHTKEYLWIARYHGWMLKKDVLKVGKEIGYEWNGKDDVDNHIKKLVATWK